MEQDQTNGNKFVMQTVFCDFQAGSSQISGRPTNLEATEFHLKIIILISSIPITVNEHILGYSDLKSRKVYFYVQKRADYGRAWSIIPWDREILNIGNHMNLLSGTFTAPVDGIYHFSLNLMGSSGGPLEVEMRKNMQETVGRAYTERSWLGYAACNLQVTLQLKKDENINIVFIRGYIYQEIFLGAVNHFTGWLVEENLTL